MHCAGCVNSIQGYVKDLPGIANVEVNLASEKAVLEYDPTKVTLDAVEKAIQEIGYRVVYEKLVLKLAGLSDSADAERLERNLKQYEGVRSASVNYGNSQVDIEYNPALISPADVRRKVVSTGYEILSETAGTSAHDIEARKLRLLFLAGVIFTIPVVLFSYPKIFGFIPLAGSDVSAYLTFVFASVVQFGTGSRFYTGAFRIAKMKSANMDTLVVLGTTTAYLFSAFNTFPVPVWHNIYYDASAVVVTFIILGKYLELKTKGRTSSVIRKMLELQPKTATVKNESGAETEIPVELIQPGDIIVVHPGEKIAVDSTVILGSSAIDESMVTGESMPVSKKVGDSVIGGTINKEGMILAKATKVGADSFLSQVVKLVEEAIGKKPAMQRLVDKFAGYFAYAVMIVALTTFLSWYIAVTPGAASAAIIPAVAILVVACPCALGLATPTAIMVGMGKAASNGVIFKSGDAMEMLSKASVAIFDKTGTLTQGKPQITDIVPAHEAAIDMVLTLPVNNQRSAKEEQEGARTTTNDSDEMGLLSWAAIAEKGSEHPLAKAIVAHARTANVLLDDISLDDFEAVPGGGVSAVNRGIKINVGSPAFVRGLGVETSPLDSQVDKLQAQGKTVVLVSVDSKIIGAIALLDTPKNGAKEAIEILKSLGIESIMLTGDNDKTAKEIAHEVGIKRVFANILPSGKVDVVTQVQKEGNKVAMVGDGINDAPALTAADVGIAIGSGTDVAIEAGKVVLIRDDIRDVVTALEIAKKTVAKIKQNLAYAFLYNIVLIPIAAVGLLYPALGGVAMAASSVSVTTSSLALKRWIPASKKGQQGLQLSLASPTPK